MTEKYTPDNTLNTGILEISEKSDNSVQVNINIVNPKNIHTCELSFDAKAKDAGQFNGQFAGLVGGSEIKLVIKNDYAIISGEPPFGQCGQGINISGSYRKSDPIRYNHCVSVETGGDELITCMNYEYKKADASLNLHYSKLKSKLSSSAQLNLRNAQASWIKFRDSDCRLYSSTLAGAGVADYEKIACLTRTTESRIAEIKYRLDGK